MTSEPYTFRKADPPATGPTFDNSFTDPFQHYVGAPAIMFDTSKLTLHDLSEMRTHPQVNASLSLMAFMLHQSDWHIECEDQKIADVVEENMRLIWTQLVRGITTAYWAGYSPCVLEWENTKDGHIFIDKIKDLHPTEAQVNWKEVESSYRPRPGDVQSPISNRIKPKVKIFDGIRKTGLGYPIPPEHAFWYPVLREHGNMYGRRLLEAAFQPWYFSLLMHLFSNRYFERFGEPTPIGRAPFQDEYQFNDENGNPIEQTGKQVMEGLISKLRSSGSVVLPSDRDPTASVRSEYMYDIEYLESQMRGADFERYLARLDEEISLSIFTPMLLMRSGDRGSLNLGVQHTQCVDPSTPILCADLTWRPAGDLRVGQEIVAFDEDATMGQGRGVNSRSYRTATIQANRLDSKPSMRLETDIGDPITASVDHPWLVWRNRNKAEHGCRTKGLIWVETQDLVVGDQIAHFAQPWSQDDTFEAGWVSGMFDGEGSMTRNVSNGDGIELTVSQVHGPVLDRLKQSMGDLGFQFSMTERAAENTSLGSKPQTTIRMSGGFLPIMEFLGRLQPTRLTQNAAERLWEGRGVRKGQSYELATVTSITDVGDNSVASIQTSTGTFITGGYLSHNTWLWSLNALAADLKEYIDPYICERIKAYNFTPNAPRVEWKPRPMGKDNTETIRAMVTTLLKNGAASVDLDDLGVALGMRLEEVREVTRQSDADPRGEVGRLDSRVEDGPATVGDPGSGGELNG